MTDPLPAAGDSRAALETAIAALAAHLEQECPTTGQTDADVRPGPSGRPSVSLVLHGGKGGHADLALPSGRRSPTIEQTGAWVSAARRLEDGQSVLLGADEAAAHARLRPQALQARFLLLPWLHRGRTGRPLRIHRAGDTIFPCSLGPDPAMANSFQALHLPAGRTGA